jgi:hypothetical protein
MKNLMTALGLDWDVRARIDQDGLETIDTKPYLNILIVGLFHLYFYAFAASVVSRNLDGLSYRFYNGLYDFSFNGFLRLFW